MDTLGFKELCVIMVQTAPSVLVASFGDAQVGVHG